MASSPEAPLPGDSTVSPPADSSTPPSPPQPESSPPPPADSTPPPPADLTQPPPADSTPPPPADSTTPSPPSPPLPESPAPPTQSPPTANPATPAVPGSPPVVSPPADEGVAQTPPSPDLPQSPPRSKHHGTPRSPPKEGPSPSSSDNQELAVILGIIFGGLVVLILIFLLLKWCQKRKRERFYLEQGMPPKGDPYYKTKQKLAVDPNAKFSPSPMGVYLVPSGEFSSGQYGGPLQNQSPNKMMGSYGAKSEFSYEVLAAATGGFSPANVIGQGGFGFVHKGVLPDGTVVAVKSLKAGSGQGEREFQAEVEIISRVHHRYLVSLVGYCIASGQRMLVYEYVSNKTLEYHLHGKDLPVMNWDVRRRIAVGSAKGLAYLHEDCHPRIIHRDIKAANILLDDNFEAKVADFGLAKLSTDNYTHVSTRVMGTFGYLAPEYAASGKLTEKSDVFSFGVMLLELITGRRPIDPTNVMEDSLVDWARPLMTKGLETGDYSELVDPRLGDTYNPTEMARMIACAAASIRHSGRKRPRMSQIVRILDGNSSLDDLNLNLNEGGAKVGESTAFNPYDTRAYNADIMKFRQMVLSDGTEDFSSGTTNEYGLNQSSGSSGADSREMGLTGPLQKPQ